MGALSRDGHTRWGLVLVVAAVLAAGLGGAAGGLGASAWLAGAVAAVTALVSGAFLGYYFPARDQRRAALATRGEALDALRPDDVSAETPVADPLSLLRADRSPMPFRGRGQQLRQLNAWRDDEQGSPVLLLSGSAGVGKSRLALEFASRLPEGWATGWLHAGTGGTAIAAIAACGEPAVILVDDADGRDDLVPLLDSLAERHGGPAIRAVLVTRSADGFRASLVARLEERHGWIASAATAIELEPEGGEEDRTRWFGEAVRAFALALGRPLPVLPDVVTHARAGVGEPFVMIQARALLAVLEPRDGQASTSPKGQPDPRALTFGRVAEALMRHEKRRWDALAKAREWGSGGPPSGALRERAVAALALLGADTDAEAEEVLRRVPELRDASAERRYEIAAWTAALYPADAGMTPRIRPDVIGEWFVVSQLTSNKALADELRAGLDDDQAGRALGFLGRAADWIEAAGPLFGKFADGDVRRQVLAAAQAALTGEAGRHLLDAVIAEQITATDEWTPEELKQLDQLIPEYVLLRTHAAIAARVVTVYRRLAAVDPTATRADLARALSILGIGLHKLGRYQEALNATQEAVTTYRRLAADNPAAHQAGLAMALGNLGVWLAELGRYQEALTATQEAVTTYRSLVADNPAAHQAGLARALDHLGVRLDRMGRYQEALTATQEAVTTYRTLAAENPAAHQADLAGALDNLGVRLSELGRYQEALTATQQAITTYRTLVTKNPAAHQTDLASALSNLGVRLHGLGRYQEALTATQEAITTYRTQATNNPAVHQAGLARALGNLGAWLSDLGRHQEALTATQQVVTTYRSLVADNPAAHQGNLARAFSNLGVILSRLGRDQEALNATREAVTTYRSLFADNPAAHQADLASALDNLGVDLSMAGRYQEALTATEEAVTIYRTLATDNPAAHQAGLARGLENLGIRLDWLDRRREALEAWTEAVSVYREMAARDPELYHAEYQRKLGALVREYEQRGMPHEALALDLKAPQPSREIEP